MRIADYELGIAERGIRNLNAEPSVLSQPDWIVITPRGRLVVRAVCMVFDRYLRASAQRIAYSKVI